MPRARGHSTHVQQMEINHVGNEEKIMTITIDSGAAESVINESHAPEVQTLPSKGSLAGVEYVNANGSTMKNKGEKLLPVILNNGEECSLRMQVTDVHRALLSVSRVCDSGHTVTFTKEGGFIQHEASGKKFEFQRTNGVYRMQVSLADTKPGFRRPA